MTELSGSHEAGPAGSQPRRLHSDFRVAAVILLCCAVVFAITFRLEEIPASLAQGMQASAFPRLVLLVLAGLTLVMVWTSHGSADPAREPIPPILYQTGGFILLFMGVLYVAGMMVATPFAILGMGRLWGERRWWLLLVIGVCLAIFLRVLFINVFGVQLPRGLIAERWW
jgi:putative tricarboxylic transport membrane protein